VRLVITGQSFMLHQIRKMVGLAVAVMRGDAPPEAVPLALEPRRDVNTPIAPDVGLFLDEGIFEAYNARWGDSRGDRVSLEPYAAEVGKFKVVHLLSALKLEVQQFDFVSQIHS
jgi:tRNA pseudouridine38-40 synthase